MIPRVDGVRPDIVDCISNRDMLGQMTLDGLSGVVRGRAWNCGHAGSG